MLKRTPMASYQPNAVLLLSIASIICCQLTLTQAQEPESVYVADGVPCRSIISGCDDEIKIVGEVCTAITPELITVTTTVTDPRCTIEETHLCNLPYVSDSNLGVQSYTIDVPLDEAYEFVCGYDDVDYMVAGHITIMCPEDVEPHRALYEIPLECGEVLRAGTEEGGFLTPVDGECKTSFAYMQNEESCHPYRLGNIQECCAQCFMQLSFEDAYADFFRWGWTNGPFDPVSVNTIYDPPSGAYDMYLWGNAEECDTSPESGWAIHTGELKIDYDSVTGEVTATFSSLPGWTLVETHLYVGNEILPQVPGSNEYTVSPAEYPSIHEGLASGTTVDVHSVGPFRGPVYVIGHVVVCPTEGQSRSSTPVGDSPTTVGPSPEIQMNSMRTVASPTTIGPSPELEENSMRSIVDPTNNGEDSTVPYFEDACTEQWDSSRVYCIDFEFVNGSKIKGCYEGSSTITVEVGGEELMLRINCSENYPCGFASREGGEPSPVQPDLQVKAWNIVSYRISSSTCTHKTCGGSIEDEDCSSTTSGTVGASLVITGLNEAESPRDTGRTGEEDAGTDYTKLRYDNLGIDIPQQEEGEEHSANLLGGSDESTEKVVREHKYVP